MGDSSDDEASLTVLGGTKAGLRFVIEDSVDNIVIGSDPSCRFQIDLPGVSPVHARIWIDPQGVTIYETNSPRGLFINDDRVVAQATLRNGDVLWLGTPGDEDVVMIQCRFPTPKGETRRTPRPPIDEGATRETVALGSLPPEAAVAESEPGVTPEADAAPEPDAERQTTPEPDELEQTQLVEAPVEPPAPATEVFMVDESLYASASKAPVPSVSEPAHFDLDFSRPAPAVDDEGLGSTVVDVARVASPPADPEPEPTIVGSAVAPPTLYDAAAEAPTPPPRPAPAPPAPSYPLPGAARSRDTPRPSKAETPEPRRAAARPASAATPRPSAPVEHAAAASASPALKYGLMAAGLLLVTAASFVVVRLLQPEAPGDTEVTPPTSVVAAPPSTLAPPPVEPAPTLAPEPEPAPPTTIPEEVVIVASATPPPPPTAAAPSVRPSAAPATPRPTPRSATPPPTVATPAVPAAPQQGQQVAGLLGQAEAALAGRNFDAAATTFDEVLKLDPQNARANQGKAAAQASAASLKRTFSPSRTTLSGKEAKADLGGFDTSGVKVSKVSDYSGRIEFDAAPPRVAPGDSYTVRIYLVNDGKKAFKISSVSVATTTNGSRAGGPIEVRAREVQVRDRVVLDERSGLWPAGTTSWTLEVVVATDRDATFTNRVTWR